MGDKYHVSEFYLILDIEKHRICEHVSSIVSTAFLPNSADDTLTSFLCTVFFWLASPSALNFANSLPLLQLPGLFEPVVFSSVVFTLCVWYSLPTPIRYVFWS